MYDNPRGFGLMLFMFLMLSPSKPNQDCIVDSIENGSVVLELVCKDDLPVLITITPHSIDQYIEGSDCPILINCLEWMGVD